MAMHAPKIKQIRSPVINGYVRPKRLDYLRENQIEKIMVHTANEVATAEDLAKRYNNDSDLEPYHYFIDSQGIIYQQLPENYFSLVSSSSVYNKFTINILVSNSYENQALPVSNDAIESLVTLCTDICKRNGFVLTFTNDTDGSLLGHYMTARTDCPGPFMKAKFHNIALRVSNRLKGLPDSPNPEKGLFRVKGGLKDRGRSKIYRTFEEAVAEAYRSGKNVYDRKGNEVYNYKLSSLMTLWDEYEPKEVGDYVISSAQLIDLIPGSNRCWKMVEGKGYMNVPAMGGMIPMDILSQTEESKAESPDGRYRAGKTQVFLDEGIIEEIDNEKQTAKVHGVWFPLNILIKKRRI